MNYKGRFTIYAVLFGIIWLLAGCGREPVSTDYADRLKKSTADRLETAGQINLRSEGFAADLCVVSGEEPEPDSTVSAEAAGVFSESGNCTAVQKHVFERLYPASMTKVMTALIALEGSSLDETVTVGEEAVIAEAGASLCHIQPGDVLTMEQLLYGLMLPSGNDAAASIAVHLAGSEEAFAERMNERAYSLGATCTHFVNPHGLHDENHYTTAYDMYLIFHEALKNETFCKIIGTAAYTAQYRNAAGEEVSQNWENSNQYLIGKRQMPEGLTVLGGKTGTTKAAGSCLIMASRDISGEVWISIVMKSGGRDRLYDAMTNIIEKIPK